MDKDKCEWRGGGQNNSPYASSLLFCPLNSVLSYLISVRYFIFLLGRPDSPPQGISEEPRNHREANNGRSEFHGSECHYYQGEVRGRGVVRQSELQLRSCEPWSHATGFKPSSPLSLPLRTPLFSSRTVRLPCTWRPWKAMRRWRRLFFPPASSLQSMSVARR